MTPRERDYVPLLVAISVVASLIILLIAVYYA